LTSVSFESHQWLIKFDLQGVFALTKDFFGIVSKMSISPCVLGRDRVEVMPYTQERLLFTLHLVMFYKTGKCTREKCVSVKNTVHTLELEVGECRIYMVSLMRAAATCTYKSFHLCSFPAEGTIHGYFPSQSTICFDADALILVSMCNWFCLHALFDELEGTHPTR
jgi:hypothetical protein